MSVADKAHEKPEPPKSAPGWNYHPELPLKYAPYWFWPPRPVSILAFLMRKWFALSITLATLIASIVCWLYFLPEPETMKTFQIGWIFQIWVRNLILLVAVAGGLHLYLYSWRKQGDTEQYDRRPMQKDNGVFTFRNQVHDNMFWSLASGLTVWTGYEVLYHWCAANNYVPTITFADSPIMFVLLILITPIWISFHFYWVHRLEHHPLLYKHVHALHHRNINVGPWSGLSFSPAEHVLYFTSVFLHFVVASNPLHVIFHMMWHSLVPVTAHSGFESLILKDEKIQMGDFFHQMHHRYFECNYGTLEIPWDRWFDTYHDGTEESHKHFKEKRQELMRQASRASGYGAK